MRPLIPARSRSLVLFAVLTSTAWLLLADSARECTNTAERGHLRLSGPCAMQLFVERDARQCSASATSESGALQFWHDRGSVELGDEPLGGEAMYFTFERLRRTDGLVMVKGTCDLDPSGRTYSCSGAPDTSTSTTASTSTKVSEDLLCHGTYEVLK